MTYYPNNGTYSVFMTKKPRRSSMSAHSSIDPVETCEVFTYQWVHPLKIHQLIIFPFFYPIETHP